MIMIKFNASFFFSLSGHGVLWLKLKTWLWLVCPIEFANLLLLLLLLLYKMILCCWRSRHQLFGLILHFFPGEYAKIQHRFPLVMVFCDSLALIGFAQLSLQIYIFFLSFWESCRENSFCVSWRNSSEVCEDLWACSSFSSGLWDEWWVLKGFKPANGILLWRPQCR